MKLLVFTDVHSNKNLLDKVISKSKDADVLICLGDLTMFQTYMKSFLRELNGIGKPVLMLPGNHENEEQLEYACKDFKHIIFSHKNYFTINDAIFFAYGGGGFSQNDLEFERISRQWLKLGTNKKKVLLTHGPPFGVSIDIVGKNHVGNKSYTDFIKKAELSYCFSGHLHENFYKIDNIGKTKILNPGPDGRIVNI